MSKEEVGRGGSLTHQHQDILALFIGHHVIDWLMVSQAGSDGAKRKR